jgi:hypothetical protein
MVNLHWLESSVNRYEALKVFITYPGRCQLPGWFFLTEKLQNSLTFRRVSYSILTWLTVKNRLDAAVSVSVTCGKKPETGDRCYGKNEGPGTDGSNR